MDLLKWDEQFSVNVYDIDDLQKKMVVFINMVIEEKGNKEEEKDITDALVQLLDYTRFYFKHEERYLNKFKYPEFYIHQKKHKEFLKKVMRFRRRYADDPDKLTDEAIKSLKNWYVNHILELDQRYAPFMRLNIFLENLTKAKV